MQLTLSPLRFRLFVARGFGMRVVGGKTGADGRLFAYIVWTVPGGPAEKNGLQQGDKVIRLTCFYHIAISIAILIIIVSINALTVLSER